MEKKKRELGDVERKRVKRILVGQSEGRGEKERYSERDKDINRENE